MAYDCPFGYGECEAANGCCYPGRCSRWKRVAFCALTLLALLCLTGCNAVERQQFWDRFDQGTQEARDASDDIGAAVDRTIARRLEIEAERDAAAETGEGD